MDETSKSLRKKAEWLLSLNESDLLQLLAGERGIQGFAKENDAEQDVLRVDQSSDKRSLIFLSYATPDRKLVSDLYERLVADGFLPWMDIKSILPGEKWEYTIRHAIRRSEFFIICLSKNAINRRGFFQKEIRIALEILDQMLDDDIYLIPIRMEECDVPESLSNLHWVNLFETHGYEKIIRAIREGEKRRKITNRK